MKRCPLSLLLLEDHNDIVVLSCGHIYHQTVFDHFNLSTFTCAVVGCKYKNKLEYVSGDDRLSILKDIYSTEVIEITDNTFVSTNSTESIRNTQCNEEVNREEALKAIEEDILANRVNMTNVMRYVESINLVPVQNLNNVARGRMNMDHPSLIENTDTSCNKKRSPYAKPICKACGKLVKDNHKRGNVLTKDENGVLSRKLKVFCISFSTFASLKC